MKVVNIKVIFRVFLLALGCIGLQLGNSQSVMAGDMTTVGNTTCSNATLNGTYIYQFDGWTIVGVDLGAERKPFAYAGQEKYDGNGKFTGIETYSVDGVITQQEAYTATYTVTSDCIASVEEKTSGGIVSHYDYFIKPSGDKFVFIQTDKGTVGAGEEFRVASP